MAEVSLVNIKKVCIHRYDELAIQPKRLEVLLIPIGHPGHTGAQEE